MTRKKKLYNKVTNPLAEFRKINQARMGKVVKSYPKYASGGPGPISPGKEMFEKLQRYSRNPSTFEQFSPAGLEKRYKKQVKRGRMTRQELDNIKEINSLNLDWSKFKRR